MNKHTILIEVITGHDDMDDVIEDVITLLDGGTPDYDADSEYSIIPVEPGEILGKWPANVNEQLVWNLGEVGFSLDFNSIFELMNYVPQKPILVTQMYLRLMAALKNLAITQSKRVNRAKEELENLKDERRAHVWSDAFQMEARKTKDSVESHVRSDPTLQEKGQKLRQLEDLKGDLWSTYSLIEKAYESVMLLAQKGKELWLDSPEKDRSFSEVAEAVVETTVRAEEAAFD